MMMTPSANIAIFDGHNDLLYQLWRRQDLRGDAFFCPDTTDLAITKTRADKGHFVGGLFAIFATSNKAIDGETVIEQKTAFQITNEMIAIAGEMHNHPSGNFRICTDIAQINQAIADKSIAAMLHLEGAEAISPDLAEIELLYEKGIRSIGPLWSRPNCFGQGVPFDFPASPDQGNGLTDAGIALVKTCDQMGILLDLSHLNEAGFWDIARISSQPLTASHSNAYALCPSPRNLTDKQLSAIAESGGLVGLCFATAYLRSDGRRDPNTKIDAILAQIDYLISMVGEDHVSLGSDFDGAVLPRQLADCSGLPVLVEAMQTFGFGIDLTTKICGLNWLSRLSQLSR